MRVLIVNTSNRPLYIEGRLIAVAGQAVFDHTVIPKAYRRYAKAGEVHKAEDEKSEADAELDPLAKLQAQSIPAIKLKLPDLAISDLQALKRLEESSPAPRAGVVDAVSTEILSRPA